MRLRALAGFYWLLIGLLYLPIVLLAAIIYGAIRWRNRSRRPAMEQIRERATRDNYRKEDAVKQG